jgi:hypothetical protein
MTASNGEVVVLDKPSEYLFEALRIDNGKIGDERPLVKESAFVAVSNDVRVYYCEDPKPGSGFNALAVEVRSSSGTADPWTDPAFTVQIIARVSAAFDGVRHIQFGDDGYVNYPDTGAIAVVFAVINDLETRYCREPDRHPLLIEPPALNRAAAS